MAKVPTARKKPAPVAFDAIWTTRTDALSLAERAKRLRQQQNETIGRLNNRLDAHREGLTGSLRSIPTANRSTIIKQSVRGRRKELADESADLRWTYVRQLADIATSAKGAEELYRSSVGLLMRKTLGSESRSRYLEQTEHSGPEELRHFAILAAATGNLELAAALVTRAERFPSADRPFSRIELADRMVGEELREVRLALATAQLAAAEGLDADTRFETGEASAHRRMELAMLRKRIDEEFAADEPEDAEEDADAVEGEPEGEEKI